MATRSRGRLNCASNKKIFPGQVGKEEPPRMSGSERISLFRFAELTSKLRFSPPEVKNSASRFF